ncbi:ferrous iron transport protein B [Prosthecobacter fusiformis]|uniref:Ferrous iron transport protein B n=1 Tax=Prosthecobacter fusiformis TaxID=48464 RepID=A0A4R7RHX7_9BACT|nr:ferrous iron transport protein B [Prosthecobacter fusiformis]TDU62491.1 ferrous iron transport protein B [Prosthecobacter fusiformis]
MSAESPLLAIVGNPNSGKTTVFNHLTGLRQKVGNYPGVTVEKKIGECYSQHGKKLRLIDLPGAYSLNARSPDEAVLRDVLLGRRPDTPRPDRVVFIADAANLERNLYLLTQVLELGLPTVLVLNMMDIAKTKEWRIDVKKLSEELGVPVVPMQATSGTGFIELKAAISREDIPLPRWQSAPLPDDIRAALQTTRAELLLTQAVHDKTTLLEPLYLLSDHDPLHAGILDAHLGQIQRGREALNAAHPGWEDQLVADRYAEIEKLTQQVLQRPEQELPTLTQKLDAFLLHPIFGGITVLAFLVFLFYLIFKVAEGPMDWIDTGFGALGGWVTDLMPPGDLRDLIVQGAIAGVGGVVIFLPQILILFFFIGIMEDTGYMARMAFILDRMMSVVGLNGKAFIPFLSSYACAIPGVMATRTIDSPKDRLITILVVPFASCSARIPVYVLLISAFMPDTVSDLAKAGVMVGLYALGTFGAFFFAWVLNKGIMRGTNAPMILEMPSYKMPALGSILLLVWQRAKVFLVRAGTIIFGISILIWAASTYPKDHSLGDRAAALEEKIAALEEAAGQEDEKADVINESLSKPGPRPESDTTLEAEAEAPANPELVAARTELAALSSQHLAQSFAGRAGHFIEPVIKPLGYDWKIGIGLIGSFAAREVFVNTMSVVYAVQAEEDDDLMPVRDRIREERRPDGTLVYTPLVCISLLVFYVFAMQCISTMAIVKRETGSWGWMWFQLGFMTGTAYLLSLAVYQVGTALGY